MPYRRAQAFREMKKQFDRIPNVELAERIRLGKIGFFDSRRAKFNWRTSLKTLKIKTRFNDPGDRRVSPNLRYDGLPAGPVGRHSSGQDRGEHPDSQGRSRRTFYEG